MKHKLLILIFYLIGSMIAFGQASLKLTKESNYYQAGDSLYKYQVVYKDPGSSGQELEWDFSHLQTINENYQLKYSYADSLDTSLICGTEHRTRYYFRQHADSVWATGFENYTTKMDYTTPELRMVFPFSYSDTLFSRFEGEGIYSNMLTLKLKGYTRTVADASGKLILPDLKVNNALRVHSSRHYTETGKDSMEMTLDTYSWYAKDIRYPVFESIKTTIHRQGQDTTVFRTSFYYTPEELQYGGSYDDSEEVLPEIEKIFTEATLYPNPVVNDLRIDYKLTRNATIWFSIHNNIGQPMSRTIQRKQSKGWNSEIIHMGHLLQGTYTLYVHVDDMVMSRVVVKK
ncbi:MAG TPA: T9SS type A sorting domain-containing protein [Bacteroidales bacterium]|nr:T9SS type A sorting domain-containing protein [Bacteroidales bacterium]